MKWIPFASWFRATRGRTRGRKAKLIAFPVYQACDSKNVKKDESKIFPLITTLLATWVTLDLVEMLRASFETKKEMDKQFGSAEFKISKLQHQARKCTKEGEDPHDAVVVKRVVQKANEDSKTWNEVEDARMHYKSLLNQSMDAVDSGLVFDKATLERWQQKALIYKRDLEIFEEEMHCKDDDFSQRLVYFQHVTYETFLMRYFRQRAQLFYERKNKYLLTA